MESFKTFAFINESANTHAADVNEIQMGFFLSNNWRNFVDSGDAKKQLADKKKIVGDEVFEYQTEKAKDMADEVLKWAKKEGYKGRVTNVWWTARPNSLTKAYGQPVDSRKNPTDVLIQFADGGFLGLSAKSTKGQGDIGFKNPGVGTIEKSLGTDLASIAKTTVDRFVKKHSGLPASAKARKSAIRADAGIKSEAEEAGKSVLNKIRDKMFDKMNSMDSRELMEFVMGDWMDAKGVGPRYIKVTGMRKGAKIEDPTNNPKLEAISTGKISIEKIGNDSIGITAAGKRIMKMRAKYESQKLASAIKFSGDPWK